MTWYVLPLPMSASLGAETRVPDAEAGVVALARAGDEAAFERLYRSQVRRVYALALRISADAAEADRLTQDVFVRAWEKLDTFRGDSSFGTWLHRLAINVILYDRRRAGRLARWIDDSDPGVDAHDARYQCAGLGLDMERAIGKLPDGARTIFVLHDVEGYDHGEIARITGLAIGTSKAQLFRARRLLRQALER